MAAELYNHKLKKWEWVDDNQVDELMSSGNYTFQVGVDIPVVNPDGKLGTIPSADAQKAFSSGFRWKTKADTDRWEKEGLADIKKENYDNSLLAGTAGALSGITLGGSDVVMRGVGEAIGEGEAVRSGLQNLKEVNPIADTAGRVGGVIAGTMLTGGALGAAGTAAKGATILGEAGAAALGLGSTGQKIAGLTAEGMLWGAGQGVSEAAIAESPEQAVDALISNITLGGVTGGAFGGLMAGGAATAPYLKKAMDASLDLLERGAIKSTRGIAKGLVKPVYWAKGEGELAKKFGELVDDPDIVKLVKEGALDEAQALFKSKKALLKEVRAEEKSMAKYIKAGLKDATTDEKAAIKSALDEAGQDVRQALANTQSKLEQLGKQYDEFTSTLTGPPVYGDDLTKLVETQAKEIAAYGSEYKAIANEIRSKTKAYGGQQATERSELELIREIKALVDQTALKGLKGDGRDKAKTLWKLMDDTLTNDHPNTAVVSHWAKYNPVYGANKNLEKIFNKSAKKGGGIENLLYSPVTKAQTAKMLGNLNEFTNEFDMLAQAGNNITKQREAYDLLKSKYRQINKESLTPENLEALKPILADIVSDPKLLKNADRLSEIQAGVAGLEGMSEFDATMRLAKLLNKPTDQLERLEKIGKNWDTIKALQSQRTNPLVDVGLGVMTGGASAPVTAMRQAANNPIGTIKVMGKVQDSIKAGKQRLKDAVEWTGKQIVSPVSRAGVTTLKTNESSNERRTKYNKAKETLSQLATPEAMMAAIEQVGGGVTNAPQLKLAIGLRLQNGLQYLQANIPQDPLAGTTIFPTKSRWEPSDGERSRFLRKVDAVNDPLIVVKRVGEGIATIDEIKAIQTVHPDVYKQLQESVINAIMTSGDQIPYSRRVQLGTLFNVPTDYSMTPEFIASMQQPYQPKDLGGRPQGGGKNIDISPFDNVQTETSRITYNT